MMLRVMVKAGLMDREGLKDRMEDLDSELVFVWKRRSMSELDVDRQCARPYAKFIDIIPQAVDVMKECTPSVP